MVLLPGLLASTRFWTEIEKKLDKNYRILNIDLLGFGRSPKPEDINYTIDDHLQSIIHTIDSAKISKPFVLVGHSLGALLALILAMRHPKLVSRLILISPPIFYSPKEARENTIRYSSLPKILLFGTIAKIVCFIFCNKLRFLTKYVVRRFFKGLPDEVADDSLLHSYKSYIGSLENVYENQSFQGIDRLRVKTIILLGLLDRRARLDNIIKLAGKNEHITIRTYPSIGHQLPLEDPQILIEQLI